MNTTNNFKMNTLYNTVKKSKFMNIVVVFIRLLIGFAFIPSGLTKAVGERFTRLSTETQIGYFFEAMYQSGGYWYFLGFSQLIASFFLMSQRYATIGALMYLAILSNIVVITISMNFTGTWIIALLMLFATLCLLAWDWNKIRYLLKPDDFQPQENTINEIINMKMWSITGTLLFLCTLFFFCIIYIFKTNFLYLAIGYVVISLGIITFSLIREFTFSKRV